MSGTLSGREAPRILLSGDVCGRLGVLFKRVNAVNKSNGPFNAILCVGQFFPSEPNGIDELQEYIEGKKEIPLPTYFTGDYGEGARLILSNTKAKADQAGHGMDGILVCHNLYWLKGSGIFELHGLRVAYLSGKFNPTLYHDAIGAASAGAHHEDDVDVLRAFADDKDVTDLFLSNEWPKGVMAAADLTAVPGSIDREDAGTLVAAELATELKPRYHVAGTEGVFYAREPYANPHAGHATRFIGLAVVGNEQKQRFLHAISPTPASDLLLADLASRPPNLTVSPYSIVSQGNRSERRNVGKSTKDLTLVSKNVSHESQSSEGQYWRYDVPQSKRQRQGDQERVCVEFVTKGTCSRGESCRFKHDLGNGAPIPKGSCFDFITKGRCERGADCRYRHSLDDNKGRGNGRAGDSLPPGVCYDFFKAGKCSRGAECRFSHSLENPNPRPPPGPCWFCLSSPDANVHLVISVGNHTYCALAKGPLVQGHVLLLPIEHFPSTISLSAEIAVELQKYTEALKTCFESRGKSMVIFERHIQLKVGTHAHLQIVPIPLAKASDAQQSFVSAAEKEGFAFQVIQSGHSKTDSQEELKERVRGGNYFYVELPDNTLLVHPLDAGQKINMQFGREVVASLLGTPEKGNWTSCTSSKDAETEMADEFKHQFQDFDPMT